MELDQQKILAQPRQHLGARKIDITICPTPQPMVLAGLALSFINQGRADNPILQLKAGTIVSL
jgi:hypothetical protein